MRNSFLTSSIFLHLTFIFQNQMVFDEGDAAAPLGRLTSADRHTPMWTFSRRWIPIPIDDDDLTIVYLSNLITDGSMKGWLLYENTEDSPVGLRIKITGAKGRRAWSVW